MSLPCFLQALANPLACLRVLVNLLLQSKDSLVLAVAANDIAQYVKFCDTGKKCVVLLSFSWRAS